MQTIEQTTIWQQAGVTATELAGKSVTSLHANLMALAWPITAHVTVATSFGPIAGTLGR